MNEADIDLLVEKSRFEKIMVRNPDQQNCAWELKPDVQLRQRAVELAVDSCRATAMIDGAGDGAAILAIAKAFYQFITGDTDANLHGQKQDER